MQEVTLERNHTYKRNLRQKAFSLASNFKKHIKSHAGDTSYKCQICNKLFDRMAGLKKHFTTQSGETVAYTCTYKRGLYYGVLSNAIESCHRSGSDKEFSASTKYKCVEGQELSTTKSLHELSLQQTNKVKPDGKLPSENESTVSFEKNRICMKLYGCGICDEKFQIEKEFVEHCEVHYCLNPQKDTFLELLNYVF